MSQNALGLIETIGLVAAIEAADAAVKAANIRLIGYELTKGGGMTVVKLSGDVGAVTAAVAAGKAAAEKVGKVWTAYVIPRPHHETNAVIFTRETTGACAGKVDSGKSPQPPESEPPAVGTETLEIVSPPVAELLADTAPQYERTEAETGATCNLCGDPGCPRKKGDAKITCIHYDKTNREDE